MPVPSFTPSAARPAAPHGPARHLVAERTVRQVRRDDTGDITALCDDGALWSPRDKADVIEDIESGEHAYIVRWTDGQTTIRVAQGPNGKYLRTDKESTAHNNLEDLPDC